MALSPEEEALVYDIEFLQAATRKVLRGLGSAPLGLQDNIATALAQWITTMTTVNKAIKTEAECRAVPVPEKKSNPEDNN